MYITASWTSTRRASTVCLPTSVAKHILLGCYKFFVYRKFSVHSWKGRYRQSERKTSTGVLIIIFFSIFIPLSSLSSISRPNFSAFIHFLFRGEKSIAKFDTRKQLNFYKPRNIFSSVTVAVFGSASTTLVGSGLREAFQRRVSTIVLQKRTIQTTRLSSTFILLLLSVSHILKYFYVKALLKNICFMFWAISLPYRFYVLCNTTYH